MTHPPVKRSKLNLSEPGPSHGGQDASSAETTKFSSSECAEIVENSPSERFSDIRHAEYFVDKSLLMVELLGTKEERKEETQQKTPEETVQETQQQKQEKTQEVTKKRVLFPIVLITAPRRFGKSVNMSMVHSFLEKQVDKETGEPIPPEDAASNVRLFDGLKIMDEKYEKFREKHFGKYAVLKATFRCPKPIISVEGALKFCKTIIHTAHQEHSYLCRSSELTVREKEICTQWCDGTLYLKFDDELVANALKDLSKYLSKHYKREELKVFALIDEYDSVFNRAMSSVKDRDVLSDIIEHCISMVSNLVRDNMYIAGVFLTGISYVAGLGVSADLGTVTSYKFLQKDNIFAEYYGFTEKEVNELFDQYKVPVDERTIAKMYYNGYQSEDKNKKLSIYNTWSVVQFLWKFKIGSYWINSGAFKNLSFAFKFDQVKAKIERAIMTFDGTATVAVLDRFTQREFYGLHSMICNKKNPKRVFSSKLLFTVLLEQGYLTYTGEDEKLRVPNLEIKMSLQEQLADHFVDIYGFTTEAMRNCKDQFYRVFSSLTTDRDHLVLLKKALEELVTPLQGNGKINHALLQQALFIPLFETGYFYRTEIGTQENTRSDLFVYKGDSGAIIELNYMQNDTDTRNNSESALKQILEKKYFTLFVNEKYFQKAPTRYFLIGLSFNAKLEVSMHCLDGSQASDVINLASKDVALSVETITVLIGKANTIDFNESSTDDVDG